MSLAVLRKFSEKDLAQRREEKQRAKTSFVEVEILKKGD